MTAEEREDRIYVLNAKADSLKSGIRINKKFLALVPKNADKKTEEIVSGYEVELKDVKRELAELEAV